MAKTSVKNILREIDQLNDSDRLKLEKELSKRLDHEWERESRAARKIARQRGIDQDMIDRAIENRRYRR